MNAERIAEVSRLVRETPAAGVARPPALPWNQYTPWPLTGCTVCGSFDLVRDGRRWCRACHPERRP